jgi:hypothetical protein
MSVIEPAKPQPLRPSAGLKIERCRQEGVEEAKVMVTNFLVILCWIVGGFLVRAIRQ